MKAETSEKIVARCLDLSESQASRLAKETETVRKSRLQNLSERQASRLASETETVSETRLQEKRERIAILEGSLTGEQILDRKRYRDNLHSDRLTSRVTLNFAKSQITCDVSDSNIDK